MEAILQKIKEKEDELAPRFTRMKAHLGRYFLDKFELKNEQGRAIKGARSVTLNDPRVFSDRVMAVLSSAEPRIEVYGPQLPKGYESQVEQLWDAIVYDCNRKLGAQQFAELHESLVTYSVLYGWIIARAWVWNNAGQAEFDILPCDPLNVSFEVGDEGLLWVANKRTRSADSIERRYKMRPSGKLAVVTDYWDSEQNVVYVDTKKVLEESSGLIPFVIHPVGLRPPIGRDAAEMVKCHGESVYFANESMYDTKNELASIALTLAYLEFQPPAAFVSPDGLKELAEYPFIPAAISQLAAGEKLDPIELGHIKDAALFLWSVVDPAAQRGSLVNSEYGEVRFEFSAIAIEKLEAHRDQVFVPHLKALTATDRDIAHLLIDQFVALGLDAQLGERGDLMRFKPSDYNKDFSVKFGMSTVSPEKRVANYSIARAAEGLLDSDTILREILGVASPEEIEAKLLGDQIMAMVPTIKFSRYYDYLAQCIKEASGDEKKSLEREQKLIQIALMQMGAMPEEKEQGKVGEETVGMPAAEAELPPLMTAEEQIQRETMRRQGLTREGR